MTSWHVLYIMASFLVVASGQGSSSICSTKPIQLDKYTTIRLHSPETSEINSTEKCSLQISASLPGDIIRLNVTLFDLGGHDPCSATQEHLMIVFSKWGQHTRGDVDTIRWCGQSYAPVLETREAMELTYFPGPNAQRGSGFNIQLSLVSAFQCGVKSFSIGLEPMYIYSPGFPSTYDNNIGDCQWVIRSKNNRHLQLDSLRFFLERHSSCTYDYLSINGDKHCGYGRVRATSRRDQFELHFHSDHTDSRDGFVLKLLESPLDVASCRVEVTARSSPVLLQLPSLVPGQVNNINCWWLVNSGSDDRVVLLDTKRFHTTAACADFGFSLYDAKNRSRPILSSCAPQQMFQTIRSSSRYLFLDVDLSGFGHSTIDVSYTVTTSPRDAAPRVLYADFALSYVWLDLNSYQDLGLLVRGSDEDPADYSTCIHLTVKQFPSEYVQALNASDYFYVFSGWNESFAELGTGCGRMSSQDLVSRGSSVFIKFNPYLSSSPRQVWLIYRLKRDCEPELVTLQSDTRPRSLQSDDAHYTSSSGRLRTTAQYPNNAFCRWLIRPESSMYFTHLRVIESNLYAHGCYDNVTAYDYNVQGRLRRENRLLEWCGTETPVVVSSKGSGVLVEFISNYQKTERGFRLDYSSVSLIDECPSLASLTAEENAKYLTSPNHPYTYPDNVDCRWRITSKTGAIKVTLLYVSIAQEMSQCDQFDYLAIYDGWDTSSNVLAKLCGSSSVVSTYVSSSIYLLVRFHSDDANVAAGFRLEYQTVDDPAHWQCNKEVYVTVNEDREITSPYYPNPYPSDTNCYWLVLAPLSHIVMLEVLDLDLPSCQGSSVLLYDGQSENSLLLARVCGRQHQNRYTTSQQAMYVHFKANSHTGSKGFRFRLRSWTYNGGCQGQASHLMAYTTKNYISSPQYPSNYPPNSDCMWRIESAYRNMTVRLDIEDIKLESSLTCNFDSVSIYEGYDDRSTRLGKLCGDHSASFWSSGIYMFVHFVSDSSMQSRGFRFAYRAVSEAPPPTTTAVPESSSGSTGAVIGGVMGGVVFLLVGITIFLCFLGRCQRCRSGASPSASGQASRGDHGSTVYVMSPVIVNQMPPPPYPGLANPSYLSEDLPPAYPAVQGTVQLPPPPLYAEIDAPPPYSDTMIESHPPSTPTPPDPVTGSDSQTPAAPNATFSMLRPRRLAAVEDTTLAPAATDVLQPQQPPPSLQPPLQQQPPPPPPPPQPPLSPPLSPPLQQQPPPPPLLQQPPSPPPQATGAYRNVQSTSAAVSSQERQAESTNTSGPTCLEDCTEGMAATYV